MEDKLQNSSPEPIVQRVNNCPHRAVPESENHPNAEETTPPASSFHILSERNRPYRNFGLMAREILVRIDHPQSHGNPHEWLKDTFTALTDRLLNDSVAPQDLVGFTINSVARVNQRPIGLSLRRKDQFATEVLLQLIELCAQSSEELLATGHLEVTLLHVHMPTTVRRDVPSNNSCYMSVTGKRDSPINNTNRGSPNATKPSTRKKGIIRIRNRDNLCLARALVVAKALLNKDESVEARRHYDYVRRCNPSRWQNRQTVEAKNLCEQANVDLTRNGGGIFELERFQEYLNDYTITVFTDAQGRGAMFQGPSGTPDHPRKNLNLLFENNHYNVISSINNHL